MKTYDHQKYFPKVLHKNFTLMVRLKLFYFSISSLWNIKGGGGRGNFPGGIFPGGKFLRCNIPGSTFPRGIFPGGIFPGGIFPRTLFLQLTAAQCTIVSIFFHKTL